MPTSKGWRGSDTNRPGRRRGLPDPSLALTWRVRNHLSNPRLDQLAGCLPASAAPAGEESLALSEPQSAGCLPTERQSEGAPDDFPHLPPALVRKMGLVPDGEIRPEQSRLE